MNGLSLLDNQILGLLFIEHHWQEHQSAPSLPEMASECNMTYSQAKRVRHTLRKKGMIISEFHTSRVMRTMRLSEYGFSVCVGLHAQEIVTAEDIIIAREREARR